MSANNINIEIIYPESYYRKIKVLINLRDQFNLDPQFEYDINQMIIKIHELAIPYIKVGKNKMYTPIDEGF